MKATALPSLEGVLAGNNGMLSLIKQKLKLTSTAELLLFSQGMFLKSPGLGGSAASYVVDRLRAHNLTLREDDEPIYKAVNRLFGSVMSAPIEVLNFTGVTTSRPHYKRLKPLEHIKDNEMNEIFLIEDLRELRFSASVFDEVSDLKQIMDRLDEWGIDIE